MSASAKEPTVIICMSIFNPSTNLTDHARIIRACSRCNEPVYLAVHLVEPVKREGAIILCERCALRRMKREQVIEPVLLPEQIPDIERQIGRKVTDEDVKRAARNLALLSTLVPDEDD